MKKILVLLVVLFAVPAWAADTAVWTINDQGTGWVELKCVITADASNNDVASPTVTSSIPTTIFWDTLRQLARVIVDPTGTVTDDADLYMPEATTSVDMLGGVFGNAAGSGTVLDDADSVMDFPVTATSGGPIFWNSLPTVAMIAVGANNSVTAYILLVDVNVTKTVNN